MWEGFTVKKEVGKEFVGRGNKSGAVEESGSWKNESPYKEELELLRISSDLRLDGTLMRQAFKASKAGDWVDKRDVACLSQARWSMRTEEHCAVGSAEEHGLPEVNLCASRRTRRCYTVVRMPTLSSLPA